MEPWPPANAPLPGDLAKPVAWCERSGGYGGCGVGFQRSFDLEWFDAPANVRSHVRR